MPREKIRARLAIRAFGTDSTLHDGIGVHNPFVAHKHATRDDDVRANCVLL